MASPTIDQSSRTFYTGPTNSLSFSFTPVANNTTLVLFVYLQNLAAAPTVTGVTASGLTFTYYGEVDATGLTSVFAGTWIGRIEVWTAPVATAAAITATVALSGNTSNACVCGVNVQSVFDITSWYDDNAGLPAKATATSGTTTVTYSTSEADDLLLLAAVCDGAGAGGTPATPAGWSGVLGPTGGGGGIPNHNITELVASKSVSATQSSATAATGASSSGCLAIIIALTADAKGVKLQTFVTCFN